MLVEQDFVGREKTSVDRGTAANDSKATPSLVSIVIVAYASSRYLSICLNALQQQTYPSFEILVVDTTPDDPMLATLQQGFPHVRFITAPKNLGYAGGNNLGFAHAQGKYLAILNPDTEPERQWLEALVVAVSSSVEPVMATSKILLFDRREQINTCGNTVHYTGLATCRGLEEGADRYNQAEFVPAISGAAFLIPRDLFGQLGGFDERFFMYLEDTDLSWRAALRGVRCLFVPESIVYHHYETRVNPKKLFFLERNRLLMLLHNLRGSTLRLMIPALLLTEFATWGFAVLRGMPYARAKLLSYAWLARNRALIRDTRHRIQRQRSVGDATIMQHFDYHLSVGQVSSTPLVVIAKVVMDGPFFLWRKILLFLIRSDA
jgi:GT2 family glycosyltransferase